MSKQTATNTWSNGLNKDLNPIVTPNTVLTDNLNGTLITYNGNEFSLQNDMGNVYTTELSEGFYPIGMTEYGGILYIVSISPAYGKYIYATLPEGVDSSTFTATLMYTIEEKDENFDGFSIKDATLMLTDVGFRILNDYTEELLTYSLSKLGYKYEIKTEPGNALEIGCFPSLSPENFGKGEAELDYTYRPLYNLLKRVDGGNKVSEFSTTALLTYDVNHPVSIEVQPSYDGSVNLILNDGQNPPRLINSGFAVLSNGKGIFVERNQGVKTNYYDETKLDILTRLINISPVFTTVDLGTFVLENESIGKNALVYNATKKVLEQSGVQHGGQLKGGNYTFYFKFGDEDGNTTDIICESGIVSIFKGTPGEPTTISGGYANEETDKLIKLTLNDVDTNYSRIYVYYTREYCTLDGARTVECKELVNPFKINSSTEIVTISGVEETIDASIEELNISYHTITSTKASCQQQNRLFLGNITSYEIDSAILQDYSYEIEVSIDQADDIGSVSGFNYSTSDGSEYYDPHNTYYNLGYWPDEIYRFGIVYIKSDGSFTPAFNVKGCKLEGLGDSNMSSLHAEDFTKSDDGIFINGGEGWLDNLCGVFKTPNINILESGEIKPLYFTFKLTEELVEKLAALNIIGYFIVRQKRLPMTICQGLGIGIDKNAYIPMLQDENGKYVAESFITKYTDSTESMSEYIASAYSKYPQSVRDIILSIYAGQEDSTISRQLIYNPLSMTNGEVIEITTPKEIYFYVSSSKEWTGLFKKQTFYTVKLIGPYGSEFDHVWYTQKSSDKQSAINDCINHYMVNQATINPNDAYRFSRIEYAVSNYNYTQSQFISNVDVSFNKDRRLDAAQHLGQGLLSLEATLDPKIQSMLNGSKFTIEPTNECTIKEQWPLFMESGYVTPEPDAKSVKLIYIPENTPLKYVDNVGFSTQAGDGINAKEFAFLETDNTSEMEKSDKIVRGHFTPFVGVISENEDSVIPNVLYNVRIPHSESYKNEFIVRANDNSEFYAVTNKTLINTSTNVFRGDCFTNTITMRMHRNFIDQTAPIAEKIVKPNAWNKYYHGYSNVPDGSESDEELKSKTQWEEINIGDLNTVSLGHWITFKCLANSNLGLRSEDTTNVSEMALMGNPRSFFPLYGISTATGMKIADSELLNSGYNATVGRRRHTLKQETPYDKSEFSTRVIFSNVSVSDSFTNGYRTFQGLAFQDYSKQFGAIIKLLPWGNNLFCVFEHGVAILPINEKALMQTTTEQSIHIYGHGVLPDQLSIISQDFGSLWADSIIRTPIGIYGVDTAAKKIWRFSDSKGFETLSDMKVQRFLNDNINLGLTKQETLGITNVKSHFNNYKGDVMFTFYNDEKKWNLCYNERQDLWVTRYSWIPLFSANIDNAFYTMPLIQYDSKPIANNIWKHGRTGVDTQFRPTLWYNEQHPFEFEFVVKDPVGLHKIFENLVIVSNNVQPKEIEFQIIGDAYMFNKARIYHDAKNVYGNYGKDIPYEIDQNGFTKDDFSISNFKPMFYNAKVEYDSVLDEYSMIISQPCKNKETYGVRLGNIQYKEDGWYTNIEPLRYNIKLNQQTASEFSESDQFASAKIRDKWLKVRIRYVGDRLAIINSVTVFENMSHA